MYFSALPALHCVTRCRRSVASVTNRLLSILACQAQVLGVGGHRLWNEEGPEIIFSLSDRGRDQGACLLEQGLRKATWPTLNFGASSMKTS